MEGTLTFTTIQPQNLNEVRNDAFTEQNTENIKINKLTD